MPNPRLTEAHLQEVFRPLFTNVTAELERLSGGDIHLLFALRRKLQKELSYQERGKPMARKVLKARKMKEQNGICPCCQEPLPAIGAELIA